MRQHTAGSRASTNFLHHPARSLRRLISLLSTFGAVAGVQHQTSRSIKPRERDLGDLRLFFLVRFLTRPTNHPRHAVCASNDESKPVRPQIIVLEQVRPFAVLCKQSEGPPSEFECRSKLHLNLWQGLSRNPQALTRETRWQAYLTFQAAVGAVCGRDFA